MPYIEHENRAAVNFFIDGLIKCLREMDCCKGDLNYVITRIVLESRKPVAGWSYHPLSDCVSVLRDAADEIARRLLGPYEDTAIRKNGDMACFDEPFAHCANPYQSPELDDNSPGELDTVVDSYIPPGETVTEELADQTLIMKALAHGWEIDDDGHLFLPGDKSNSWASKWKQVEMPWMTVFVPHWLERRMKELEKK